jgi:hypothetical protein
MGLQQIGRQGISYDAVQSAGISGSWEQQKEKPRQYNNRKLPGRDDTP